MSILIPLVILIGATVFAGTNGQYDFDDSSESFYTTAALPPTTFCDKNINLTVFYEGECNGSDAFILEQLMPVANHLYKWLHITLIPYGISTISNGKVSCQHGPGECLMNRIHICSFARMNKKGPQGDLERVSLAECLLTNIFQDPEELVVGKKCTTQFGLDWLDVKQCAMREEGRRLEKQYLALAMSIHAPAVPYVAYNRYFGTGYFQNLTLSDLNAMVEKIHCKKVTIPTSPTGAPNTKKPSTCPVNNGPCQCNSISLSGECCELLAKGYALQETHTWKLVPPTEEF